MLTENELNWIRQVLNDYEPGISASYFYRRNTIIERNKNKGIVRKELDSLREKMIKYTPQELLVLKSKKVRESWGINNFSGIYIIHNCVKDLYYIGQAEKVFDRAYTHFVKNPNRYELNVQINLPEIYHDYNFGDKFSISLIPLGYTAFSTLNELEDNAIRAYDSLVPNGYNKNPGNVMDKPIFANDDFEKAANLILDQIKGTEIFLTLTNNRKRFQYSIDLLSELGLPKNSPFAYSLADLIKAYQKTNKKRILNKEKQGDKLQDRQLKYVLRKYIIPEKEFDFDEIRTQEELNDVKEGFEKFNKLSDKELTELFLSIRNGTFEL
ncbi:GIY-YIG nuclease family protein [Bacillus pseudomycoides]|uniref:GIY-YIG nuclease family protein n=1 Tax=Bacillus pseudomycoides TaxID=64104 RepID=UPI000BF045E3|nr:GIY-YIG nuclease family protein [Bacillus pseudomycoides]PEM69305.1 excinuclease ABC subunit C [Bacillus pseudomycoides]PGA62230.1 excinuclease ABC subunit C [Bacillus pseudomycoides]